MKKFIYPALTAVAAVVVVVAVYLGLAGADSPGYVLIGVGTLSVTTTFAFACAVLIAAFFVFYAALQGLFWLLALPGKLRRRGRQLKFNRSQQALIAGLVDTAEGNFEKAEQVLIKHASHSGAPLLHYLTAARAAQSRGAFDRRDEYLSKASSLSDGANLAVALTQAELHLSGKEFDQALATLTDLHAMQPGHAGVLKLLHQAYLHVGDWQGLRKILPALHTQKVLLETEVKLLETQSFSNLLKQTAETGDPAAIGELWAEVPAHVKKMPGVAAIYFAAMINAGAGGQIEDELATAIADDWDATLLVLYGSVQSKNSANQLRMAERWLELHPDDAVLLMVLGKLSWECAEPDKARAYLGQSIAIDPTVQAHQLLGDVCYAEGDKDGASQHYKLGLQLASAEVVSRIDTVK